LSLFDSTESTEVRSSLIVGSDIILVSFAGILKRITNVIIIAIFKISKPRKNFFHLFCVIKVSYLFRCVFKYLICDFCVTFIIWMEVIVRKIISYISFE